MQRKSRRGILSRLEPLLENWRRYPTRPSAASLKRELGLPTPRITELTHWMPAEQRFRTLAGLPWSMWLDSAAADERERFDILVADPYVTLQTRGALTRIAGRGQTIIETQRSPFELVREELDDVQVAAPGLPFSGGAVGYFGYDLGRRLERIPAIAA